MNLFEDEAQLTKEYKKSVTFTKLLFLPGRAHSRKYALLYRTSFRPMPTARRSLRSAVPPAWVTARREQAPWTPWYTSLIPVSVHMFHPNPQVYF